MYLRLDCTRTRPEIAAHRNKNKHIPLTELPDLHDRTFFDLSKKPWILQFFFL